MDESVPISDEMYIETRLCEQQKYHSRKSTSLKKKYVVLSVIVMILSAVIPVITLVMDYVPLIAKIAAAACGGASSVITGYISLTGISSLYIEYRITSERLKALEFLYKTQTPPFNSENAYAKMVEECENIIYGCNDKWYDSLKASNDNTAAHTGS